MPGTHYRVTSPSSTFMAAELLEHQHPELASHTEPIRRGVGELKALSEGLKRYELVVAPKATPEDHRPER